MNDDLDNLVNFPVIERPATKAVQSDTAEPAKVLSFQGGVQARVERALAADISGFRGQLLELSVPPTNRMDADTGCEIHKDSLNAYIAQSRINEEHMAALQNVERETGYFSRLAFSICELALYLFDEPFTDEQRDFLEAVGVKVPTAETVKHQRQADAVRKDGEIIEAIEEYVHGGETIMEADERLQRPFVSQLVSRMRSCVTSRNTEPGQPSFDLLTALISAEIEKGNTDELYIEEAYIAAAKLLNFTELATLDDAVNAQLGRPTMQDLGRNIRRFLSNDMINYAHSYGDPRQAAFARIVSYLRDLINSDPSEERTKYIWNTVTAFAAQIEELDAFVIRRLQHAVEQQESA